MKKLVSLALALCLLLACLPMSAGAATVVLSEQNLSVDGVTYYCEKYNIDGSNYFKLRDLACLLSGTPAQFAVSYDAAANAVVIAPGLAYEVIGGELISGGVDNSASAVPSPQTVWFLDAPVEDLSIYNIGGSNFFKLRDLGKLIGFEVDYDPEMNTAIVLSGAPLPTEEKTPQQESFDGLFAWVEDNYNDSAAGNPAFTASRLFGGGSSYTFSLVAANPAGLRALALVYQRDDPDGGADVTWLFLEPEGRDFFGTFDDYRPGGDGKTADFSAEFTVNADAFDGSRPLVFDTAEGPLAGQADDDMARAAATGVAAALMELWDLCQVTVIPRETYRIEDFGFETARLSTAGQS